MESAAELTELLGSLWQSFVRADNGVITGDSLIVFVL